MRDKAYGDMLLVYESLPPHRQEAMLRYAMLVSQPESIQVHDRFASMPDRDEKLYEAFLSGDVGATLLVAHDLERRGLRQDAQTLFLRAYELESAEAAFFLGFREMESSPAAAVSFLQVAIERGHGQAPFALATLCQDLSPEAAGLSQEDFEEMRDKATALADQLLFALAREALVTGTHPVQYMNHTGIPWGTGSFFLVTWKGRDFAITAAHVLKASDASWDEARLIVPGQVKGLPYKRHGVVDFLDEEGEPLDLHVWELDRESEEEAAWEAWDLDVYWRPASSLTPNTPVFVTGYPNTEDKIDFERLEMVRAPLIVRARLSASRSGDLFEIQCGKFSVDVDGLSGGPVFAMIGGTFFFVGMALWGGTAAQRIYFRDASQLVQALDKLIDGSAS